MLRKSLVFGLAAGLLQACGGDDPVHFDSPPKHAFVADGSPVAVRVKAESHERVELSVDGGPPTILEAQGGGEFLGEVAAPPGRHHLVATLPDVPGAVDVRDVFIGRAPDAPIDGFGFSDPDYALTLTDAKPSNDGLYAGKLAMFSLEEFGTPFYRVLSNDGVFAAISGAGLVAWMDSWSHGRGTLHFGPVDGAEAGRVKDARSLTFAPGGETIGVLDDGVVVLTAGSSHRVTHSSRAFVFSGPGGDLASFSGDDGTQARTATFASAPDYEPVVLSAPVFPVIASNPVRREAVMAEYRDPGEERGPLVLYDYEQRVVDRPFEMVGGFTFSRDGQWLLALVNVIDDSASIGLLRRDGVPAQIVLDGAFSRAGFDDVSERIFAIEQGGLSRLFVAHLDDDPPLLMPIAIGITNFFALPDRRLLLLNEQGELALVDGDDAVTVLGKWNPDLRQVSLSADGETLAFTAIAGSRKPIRRVDMVNMHIGDLGEDASKPLALGGGAIAWAERNGEALDLWMLPTWPGSILGPRRVKGDVDPFRSFAPSPDGVHFALVAGDRVWCFDGGAGELDLGQADATRHDAFFLSDGRLARFGVDGPEKRVLFIERCD